MDWQIVIPHVPEVWEEQAAKELKTYLREMTGLDIPIADDQALSRRREFLIGCNSRLEDLGVQIDDDALGAHGFHIRTVGTKVVIVGGPRKGVLYGVYALLEDYFGCRRYSSFVSRIPRLDDITLPDINVTQVPVITMRDLYYRDAWAPDYADWHKTHMKASARWGMYVHTFGALVPPKKYFDEHPEYFSEVGGKRVPTGQLCLTNEDVYRIVVDELRRRMAEKPDAEYWSVSQNDTFGNCTCEKCRAIDEREGSPSGSLIEFVNRVAEEFPDKTISTLAYQYSRSAPKNLKPLPNVNIVLCSIECNRSKPIATDPLSESFRKDVEDWGRICNNILIWDYVIQFKNLVSPFPNLRVLQPNIQYFVNNGCVAMFPQGNRETGGEFAELRAYLLAKLLWNPDIDVDAVMDDFLDGYYGAAAPYVRQYIDVMHDALGASGERLDIFGNPQAPMSGYLSADLMRRYNSYFDFAEDAVADDAEVLERVRVARLPLMYATLEQAKAKPTSPGGVFERDFDGAWQVRQEIYDTLDDFVTLAVRTNISRVTEWHTTPGEYRERYLEFLDVKPLNHMATGKKAKFLIPYSPKYAGGGEYALTNGLRGDRNFELGWVGFEGTDIDVVVDLEKRLDIERVAVNFLQSISWWIFLPEQVEFLLSDDGEEFRSIGKVTHDIPVDQGGDIIHTFDAKPGGEKARYVRVKARGLGKCPKWHHGAGGDAWTFVDEIVVE